MSTDDTIKALTVRISVLEEFAFALIGSVAASAKDPEKFRRTLLAEVEAAFHQAHARADSQVAQTLAWSGLLKAQAVGSRLEAAAASKKPDGKKV